MQMQMALDEQLGTVANHEQIAAAGMLGIVAKSLSTDETLELLELNLEAARESFADMRTNASDPAMRSPTTNIVTEMLDDGIDISNEAMVQEWIDGYNARSRHERY